MAQSRQAVLCLLAVAASMLTEHTVDASCQLLLPPLVKKLSAQLATCSCENLLKDFYNLRCDQLHLTMLPCSSRQTLSAAADLGFARVPETVALHANFSSNAITVVDDDCFINYAPLISSLDLSNNMLTAVDAASFRRLEARLHSLILSKNQLRSFTAGTFATMRLRILDLSDNVLVSPCGLRVLSTNVLRLDGNAIMALSEGCFNAAPTENFISRIDLSRNKISSISPTAFDGLQELRELNMAGNMLSDVGDGALTSLGMQFSLRSLNLSSNAIASIEPFCSCNLSQIELLDLSRNAVRTLGRYCFKLYSRVTTPLNLCLSGNRIAALDENAFSGLEGRLLSLQLNLNGLSVMAATTLDGLSRLRELDLADNRLTSMTFLCDLEAESLERVSLRNNALHSLQPSVLGRQCFRGLRTLRELDLSGNLLHTVVADAFTLAPSLALLDLSNNELMNLQAGAFASQSSLRRLRLSNNALAYIGRCAFERSKWGAVAASLSLSELHYNGNPLHCDCDIAWLHAFSERVNERGMRDGSVAMPIRRAACTSPSDVQGRNLVEIINGCQECPFDNVCLGLVLSVTSDGHSLNATWTVEHATSNGTIDAALSERDTGKTLPFTELSLGNRWAYFAPLQSGTAYKLCLTAIQGKSRQKDCHVHVSAKTTRREFVSAAATVETGEMSSMHLASAFAVTLAVLILLVVMTTVVVVYVMRRKYRVYLPQRSENDLRSQANTRNAVVRVLNSESAAGKGGFAIIHVEPTSCLSEEHGFISEWTPMRRIREHEV